MRNRGLRALEIGIVVLAAAAALAPLPAPLVERYYSDWLYPGLQLRLTSWSNLSGLSLFDALIAVTAICVLVVWVRALSESRRRRSIRPALGGLGLTVVLASAFYLWFAIAWGLNYARSPLEEVIGYDASRVTQAALVALAERAATEVNTRHRAAHDCGFPATTEMPADLVVGLHHVERQFGRPVPTRPGRPKRTLLAPFFRASGVDGMHAPFLLETLVNPDLTPAERPAVLAHEWAHLAGYAPEDDASFVGLLAALHGNAAARYSAWLSIFHDTVGQLPSDDRRRLLARLEAGPRADREAIVKRLAARIEPVSRVSWETYDRYLKSQGVREGVQSYSRVVQLLLGSPALDQLPQ